MEQRKLYCADLHLDHKMILKHTKRPFETVEEQLEVMLRNFNSVLRKGDNLYVLGDTCIKNASIVEYFFANLVTKMVHLIPGNHDVHNKKVIELPFWASVSLIKEVKDNGTTVVMCHYPIARWNKCGYGSIHLHGHSHGNYQGEGNICDVGVDCWDFRPVTLEEVKQKLGG